MKIGEMYPSRFVKGEDIAARGSVTVTMRNVTIEKMGKEQEENYVLWFERQTKGMVLKKTNAMTIKGLYGDDTDDWRGKRITLTTKQERAFGAVQTMIVVVNQVPPDRNVPQKILEPTVPPRYESWEATEYRRRVVELSNAHDSLFMDTSDVSDLRAMMVGSDVLDGEPMSAQSYVLLLASIDETVGSVDCAETILSYLLGRVVGKDTKPGLEAGGVLLDGIAPGTLHDWADALMAVWGVIKDNVKAS